MKVKINLIAVSLLAIGCVIIISCVSSNLKFTSSTKLLLNEYYKAKQNAEKKGKNITLPEKIVNDYALKIVDDNYVVKAFIKINDSLNEDDLNKVGVSVNSKINNTWSVIVPLNKIEDLSKVNGVELIDVSIKSQIRSK